MRDSIKQLLVEILEGFYGVAVIGIVILVCGGLFAYAAQWIIINLILKQFFNICS